MNTLHTAPRLPRSGNAALAAGALIQAALGIAIELLIVPLAFGIAWLEFGRFRALRT